LYNFKGVGMWTSWSYVESLMTLIWVDCLLLWSNT